MPSAELASARALDQQQFVLVLPSLPYYAAATTVRVDIIIIMRLLAMASWIESQLATTAVIPSQNGASRCCGPIP